MEESSWSLVNGSLGGDQARSVEEGPKGAEIFCVLTLAGPANFGELTAMVVVLAPASTTTIAVISPAQEAKAACLYGGRESGA